MLELILLIFHSQSIIILINLIYSMSDQKRTKRANTMSDKTSASSSKKTMDPQLQLFGNSRHKFESFSIKNNQKQQKIGIQSFIDKTLFALDHYYKQDTTGFYIQCKNFLTKGWQTLKLKLHDRMSTYEYLEIAIKHKPFTVIQAQILKQWKKNYVLFGIMTYWYKSAQKFKFYSIKEFQQYYKNYQQFVSQVTYFIFKGCLQILEKKNVSVIDKLVNQTSHFIITDSSQFKKVYQQNLYVLLKKSEKHKTINWEFDLKSLNFKEHILDLKKEEQLKETIQVMKKFTKETKISKKIQLLKQLRATLQKELKFRQDQMKKLKIINVENYILVQKDEFVDCYIYCIIKGEVDEIQTSLDYMTVLLGDNSDLLSKLEALCYKADLDCAVQYLSESQISQFILHPISNIQKTQSDPFINLEVKSPFMRNFNSTKQQTTSLKMI